MASIDNGDEELILFQCKRCNSIITDSSNSDGANADLGIIILLEHPITLKRKPSLQDGQSKEAECTFHVLDCANCGAAVGKLFQAVPEEFLELSGRTTLQILRLQFYTVPLQLNSSKMSRRASSQNTTPEMKEPRTREEDEDDSLKSVRSDIQKMQYVMCHFDERIRRIEKMLQLPDIEEDGTKVSGVSLATSETTDRRQSRPAMDTFVISPSPRMQGEFLTTSSDNMNLVDRLSVIERDLENRKGTRNVSRSDSESQERIANHKKLYGRNGSQKKRAAAEQPSSQERKKQRKDSRGKSK